MGAGMTKNVPREGGGERQKGSRTKLGEGRRGGEGGGYASFVYGRHNFGADAHLGGGRVQTIITQPWMSST